MRSVILLSRTGCFLPFLIIFNLFFGWIFLKPLVWASVELILLLIFAVNGLILAKSISSVFPGPEGQAHRQGRGDAVDTQAEVIKEDKDRPRHLE